MANLTAVEFALCVLAMFGRVLDENRMAVHVLLEAIKSYNPLTGHFGKRAVKQAGYGGRGSLRAIAGYLGKDYQMKEIRTEEGAQAILHTILDPVLGSLTRQELAKMRKDVDEGIRLASSAPLEEVRARVAGFIVDAWKDGRREHWIGVWNKGMGAEADEMIAARLKDVHTDPSTSTPVVASAAELSCNFAVIPVMSTLKRRARVPRSSRSAFPSPVDVCLGRSSSSAALSSSGQWYKDTTPVWHPHGWKTLYPASGLDCKHTAPMDFKFPPAGMHSASAIPPSVTMPVDPERALEMSAKLKQWEDEWEKQQLGRWKAGILDDNALWMIVECTRDEKMWHAHGWKKYDGTARSAHKKAAFKFPAPGSSFSPTMACRGDSTLEQCMDIETKETYRNWEDSWETEQLGKWSSGLKMPTKAEGGLWKRLAMAWKSERVDMWAGMVEQHEEAVEMVESTGVGMKIGRLFGLA